jgi:RimJ/RimL family protein N-acetyltransferase
MNNHIDFLEGKLVRLIPLLAERDTEKFLSWNRNSEFQRLAMADRAQQFSKDNIKKWLEKAELSKDEIFFMIQTIDDARVIGNINLEGFDRSNTNAFVGISIGEPKDWGKGYGTESMRLILKYGFDIMNLHRITLNVFEYNERAIRSYEKVGFKHEGIQRKWINRNEKRWDLIWMGILRSDWINSKK